MLLTYDYQTFLQRLLKLTIYTDIYDIQLHVQTLVWANTNWMAGCSLDFPCLCDCTIYTDVYDTQQHFQTLVRANNNYWRAVVWTSLVCVIARSGSLKV